MSMAFEYCSVIDSTEIDWGAEFGNRDVRSLVSSVFDEAGFREYGCQQLFCFDYIRCPNKL